MERLKGILGGPPVQTDGADSTGGDLQKFMKMMMDKRAQSAAPEGIPQPGGLSINNLSPEVRLALEQMMLQQQQNSPLPAGGAGAGGAAENIGPSQEGFPQQGPPRGLLYR